ncbi:conserved Plasmodium protein, unknown function [Plasmodium ovale curtisi]|uniref:Uncharacterized protein n=1 Tax=Plasmodium ovale curtisi TaxID=864141 RepID=A0A1A8VNB2_PLAOA|nr:conserved Plasmodium protein, unknown function [Plasmodium ovale curtisi]SBS80800.1 conserved Plasmodium protein, unknown function [Plasmodium ovale curtisi]
MNSIRNKLVKEIKDFKRTALLKGSPAFRISVWFSEAPFTYFTLACLKGLTVGLVWILISEYNNPKSNNLFFKKKEAELFTSEEIEKWNKPYFSKSEHSSVEVDASLPADHRRRQLLKKIAKERIGGG